MAIPRWAWAVVAVIALFVVGMIALAGAGVYFVTRQVQVREASPARAQSLFERSRERFKDSQPLIELDTDGEIVRTRLDDARAKVHPSAASLDALHVLAWDADNEKVVQLAIPFWLLRLKRGPIDVFSDTAGLRRANLRITVDELEGLGPSLLIDHRGRHGDRVLVWTQ
jgi:hypothetical protein